jgi:hypothetical protein
MATGRLQPAGGDADAALRELRSAGPTAPVLAVDLRIVQGEFFLRAGDREKGRLMIRQGVKELLADISPDAWSQTVFRLEALGRVARDVGDWTLASELADEMRRHDPLYAGTSYARARAAEQRGDRSGAATAYAEALRAWSDADPDLFELADARSRLKALSPEP